MPRYAGAELAIVSFSGSTNSFAVVTRHRRGGRVAPIMAVVKFAAQRKEKANEPWRR